LISDFGLKSSPFNPQSEIPNPQSNYGSSRFCAIHCGTVCGCCSAGSFAPIIFFQKGGDVWRAVSLGSGFTVVFLEPELGVTAATVLFHADFVLVATLCAPFFTDCIGEVLGAGAFSTHLFLVSPLGVDDLLESDFGHWTVGQLTFFCGVFTIHLLSLPLSALVGICTSCDMGPAVCAGAAICGTTDVAGGNVF
jgi:hypothetical protein